MKIIYPYIAKKITFFLFLCMFLCTEYIYAQNKTDSLINRLNTASLSDTSRVDLILSISYSLADDDAKKSFQYAFLGLAKSENIKYNIGKVNALNHIGALYYRISKYDSSIYYLQKALNICQQSGRDNQLASILNNLGNNYLDLSQFNIALDNYTKALVYMRKNNNLLSEAYTMANIGMIYRVREQYDKALEFHLKSLDLHRLLHSSSQELSIGYLEIAEVLTYKNNLKLAEVYIDSAELYISPDKDDYQSCILNSVKGDISVKKKQYNLAVISYLSSINLANKISYERGVIDTKIKLANAYFEKGEYTKTMDVALEANQASYKLSLVEQISQSELALSKAYAKVNDFQNSYIHLNNYRIYTDTLHDIERNNLLAEMQTRFASQEKEFENEGLRKQQLAKDELIQTQSNFLYVVVGASLLLLAFSIYEFIQYRKKQQLNNELTRLNEDILKQKDELELQAIELSKLSKEIEEKNKLLEKDNERKALSIQDKEKRILDFAFFNAHELRACVARILGLVNVFKHSYYSKEDLTNIVDMVEKSTLGLDVIVKDFGNRLINIEAEDKLEQEKDDSNDKA